MGHEELSKKKIEKRRVRVGRSVTAGGTHSPLTRHSLTISHRQRQRAGPSETGSGS